MDFLPYFFITFVLLNVYFTYKIGWVGVGTKIAGSENVDQLDFRFKKNLVRTSSSH